MQIPGKSTVWRLNLQDLILIMRNLFLSNVWIAIATEKTRPSHTLQTQPQKMDRLSITFYNKVKKKRCFAWYFFEPGNTTVLRRTTVRVGRSCCLEMVGNFRLASSVAENGTSINLLQLVSVAHLRQTYTCMHTIYTYNYVYLLNFVYI